MISPVVILPQPGIAVGVEVGVNVMVGVKVTVGVGEMEGVTVGVLVGRGVNVTKGPEEVSVGVFEAAITVDVGVLDGIAVAGVEGGVDVGPGFDPTSMNPRMVRALNEVNVWFPSGTRVTSGLYVAETVTNTRSPEETVTVLSSPVRAVQLTVEEEPGPVS